MKRRNVTFLIASFFVISNFAGHFAAALLASGREHSPKAPVKNHTVSEKQIAAGNNNSEMILFPAGYKEVIAVRIMVITKEV